MLLETGGFWTVFGGLEGEVNKKQRQPGPVIDDMYVYMYVYIYILYVYIYIFRERERGLSQSICSRLY